MSQPQQPSSPSPAIVDLKQQLDGRVAEFKAVLPSHVSPERFIRVVLTAAQNNSDILRCDRRSLLTACLKAAQDGLLPDGREGVIIPFRDRERGEVAQWLVMIAGLRKKARQSGEVTTWECHVVHQQDSFDYELGDKPFIRHRPAIGDRGPPIAAYSICKLKSGEVSREIMSIAEINSIRARSRAKESGPWVTDFNEMARKTVARRHSKVLPTSTDLDQALRHDDDIYDLSAASADTHAMTARRRVLSLSQKLDQLAILNGVFLGCPARRSGRNFGSNPAITQPRNQRNQGSNE